MDSFAQLFIFSLVMLAGSYGAGSAPLFMPMSEEKLQLVSVLGAGLLVGVALAVIIPEGVMTLIKAYTLKDHAVDHISGPSGPSASGPGDPVAQPLTGHHDSESHHDHAFEGMDRAMGVSLVLGFIFMMLIDQLASTSSGGSSGSQRNNSISDAESLLPSSGTKRNRNGHPVNWTTTLGLVVHAAADGIALGAAAATHQLDVEVIVFLAIMLHKAPAAFGLVTFLLHEGLDKNRAKKHLLIFSLSAPVMAVTTYIFLSWSGGSGGPMEGKIDTFQMTGIAMLFSAGTFLYVATVHVLPEVTSIGSGGHSHGFSKCELLMLISGALMPLLLTLGHHH